jgi:hypothetical protein
MTDTPFDLSVLVEVTPGLTPEARERLASRLQTLIESEHVDHVESRRTWLRAPWTHRAVVIAVAAAIVLVFFVPLPRVSLFHRLSQSQNGVSPGGSTTPKGWVPITLGAAQIAVPSSWWVFYDRPDCPMGKGSEVLVNPTYAVCPFPPPGDVPANVIELYRYVPDKLREHREVVNGITVYGTGGNWYDVPSLGIAMAIQGPLGGRVLHTLTRSPQGRNTTTTVPNPLPAVDLSATPSGWVPVDFRDAQVSVPANWVVAYHTPVCGSRRGPGELDIDPLPPGLGCGAADLAANHVQVEPLGTRQTWPGMPRREINGRTVYGSALDGIGVYQAPSLGIVILLRGPLRNRVLDTLTWSPRAVALAPDSAPVVASSWRPVTFAGLQFSVPADWPVNRTQVTPNLGGSDCQAQGAAFLSTAVTLSTDTLPLIIATCLYSPLTLRSPPNAVQVDSGSRWASSAPASLSKPPVAFSKHCFELHGVTACPATSPAYSILVLKVSVQGRSKLVYVSIGLAGNGMVARTILYSLGA